MKLDLTKLPVAEMVMGFLLVMLAVTFIGAFAATNGDDDQAAAASPTSSATTPGGGTPGPGGLAVRLLDNKLDPNKLTVGAGSEVTIDVTNAGTAIHNLRIAGADNKFNTGDDAVSDPQLVSGGGHATITWKAPGSPGTIDFRCDFHPADMAGQITVQ